MNPIFDPQVASVMNPSTHTSFTRTTFERASLKGTGCNGVLVSSSFGGSRPGKYPKNEKITPGTPNRNMTFSQHDEQAEKRVFFHTNQPLMPTGHPFLSRALASP